MAERFNAPEPIDGERVQSYMRRLIAAFEDWVNERMGRL